MTFFNSTHVVVLLRYQTYELIVHFFRNNWLYHVGMFDVMVSSSAYAQ